MSADVFDIYGGTVGQGILPPREQMEYRAAVPFLADEDKAFILAHMSNGDLRLVSYGYLVEIISIGPDILSFVYTNGVLHLRGENVRSLLPMFQQREVKELHPFNTTRHTEPEAGAVIINDMRWRTVEQALADADRG